jgi:hypothetical protein
VYILDKVIQEFAPDITDIYNIREDESEEQQIKTGRLHECRILGIMLKFYLEGKTEVTTREVEFEYKKYFKEIARSTVSTYLNMLNGEATLEKIREGRVVYYKLTEDPPDKVSPFWFTRLFCIDPAYFVRAIYFASLYSIADKIVMDYSTNEEKTKLVFELKYIIGLIILLILKNRASKCELCQFGKIDRYNELLEGLNKAIKDRSDVLSEDLTKILKEQFSEIPIFGGTYFNQASNEMEMIKALLEFSKKHKKDIEFQTMVLKRRLETKILNKLSANVEEMDQKEQKATN